MHLQSLDTPGISHKLLGPEKPAIAHPDSCEHRTTQDIMESVVVENNKLDGTTTSWINSSLAHGWKLAVCISLSRNGVNFIEHIYSYIEDIWFFRCKIDFYYTEWTPKAVFSRVPLLVFMSEIKINLHRKNQVFCFFYAKMPKKNNLFQCVSHDYRKLTFFLVISHQKVYDAQRVYWVWYWV